MGRNILNLYKLVRYDMKNGLWSGRHLYLLVMVLGLVFSGKLYVNYTNRLGDLLDPEFTMANLLFHYFQGREPYLPEAGEPFVFPAAWMSLFLLCAFLTLEYPFHNLNGHGVQVLTRMRSRRVWWVSKCIWMVATTALYFVLLYGVTAAFCGAFGIGITMDYGAEANELLLHMEMAPCSTGQAFLMLYVLPVTAALAANSVQLVLGFFLDRTYCFLATAALLFASAYFHTPLLIGNHAMVKRSVFCTGQGLSPGAYLAADLAVTVACMAAGLVLIQRHDILNKKDS